MKRGPALSDVRGGKYDEVGKNHYASDAFPTRLAASRQSTLPIKGRERPRPLPREHAPRTVDQGPPHRGGRALPGAGAVGRRGDSRVGWLGFYCDDCPPPSSEKNASARRRRNEQGLDSTHLRLYKAVQPMAAKRNAGSVPATRVTAKNPIDAKRAHLGPKHIART